MTTAPRRQRSPADEAWVILRQLLGAERRRFLAVASELDLHPAQARALMQMEPEIAVPMHELATMLACDNSNVTGIIDRLEARGLVTRRPYAQDRRVKHVVLTPAGAALREHVRAGIARAPESIRRLSVADQRLLRDVLQRAVEKDDDPRRAA
jgi:MarR family transcriptional regulator, organic hydroperoxide resistance regulator